MKRNSNNISEPYSEISVSEALVWAKRFASKDEGSWSFETELLLSEVIGIDRITGYRGGQLEILIHSVFSRHSEILS